MIKASGLAAVLGTLLGIVGVIYLGVQTPQGAALLIVIFALVFSAIGMAVGALQRRTGSDGRRAPMPREPSPTDPDSEKGG
jgi:hypothetical protein